MRGSYIRRPPGASATHRRTLSQPCARSHDGREEVFPDHGSYDISAFTMAEIRQLDAGSWFGPEFVGEPVPTLDRWWASPVPPGLAHRLVIQSFDWVSMKRSQALLARIPHGLPGRSLLLPGTAMRRTTTAGTPSPG